MGITISNGYILVLPWEVTLGLGLVLPFIKMSFMAFSLKKKKTIKIATLGF